MRESTQEYWTIEKGKLITLYAYGEDTDLDDILFDLEYDERIEKIKSMYQHGKLKGRQSDLY